MARKARSHLEAEPVIAAAAGDARVAAQDAEPLVDDECGNDNEPAPFPLSGFYGVVLRAVERGPMRYFEIILGHNDVGCSRLIAVHDTDEQVIADWRNLGARLCLPLFILGSDGTLQCATEEPAGLRQRRHGSALSGRRPRFLARRREGQPCLMATVHPVRSIGPSPRF